MTAVSGPESDLKLLVFNAAKDGKLKKLKVCFCVLCWT